MTTNKFCELVLDTMNRNCKDLSKADYLDALENIQDDIDSRIQAVRDELKNEEE